ncbi:Methylisocitrate lyase [Tsuneonella dongtanensis]|uniref:Methylisocitrate lyase n=1 Tax=Tsuneonella dongtanensis TaxID=692370 RepID=A0A1B2AE35_9SPHN|nr:isocitrate lyase/phosphoenolpyruvate mutase family protein [Tsuneonella dongtanensis]ANY20305.1 Methylisocitrate lyase [Tsuneonella dongtanensis]
MMDKVKAFRALHVPGNPLILFNIWDPGSARAVAEAGAHALATGSHGVAEASGYLDGEKFPLGSVLENLRRIVSVSELPVTLDLEAGYGSNPDEVGRSVAAARDAGAIGINMEDRLPGEAGVLPVAEASARIAAAAASGLHVNARTDVYRDIKPADYAPSLVESAIERSKAYADAGAGSLFVPFLGDHSTIARICKSSALPVNIMWAPGRGTRDELAGLGVARISYGGGPWRAAMDWLTAQARVVFSGGTPPYAG